MGYFKTRFKPPPQDKADVDFLLKQIDRLGDAHAVAGRKLRSLRREVARQAAANPALRPQDSVSSKAAGSLAVWLPAVALTGAASVALFYAVKRFL